MSHLISYLSPLSRFRITPAASQRPYSDHLSSRDASQWSASSLMTSFVLVPSFFTVEGVGEDLRSAQGLFSFTLWGLFYFLSIFCGLFCLSLDLCCIAGFLIIHPCLWSIESLSISLITISICIYTDIDNTHNSYRCRYTHSYMQVLGSFPVPVFAMATYFFHLKRKSDPWCYSGSEVSGVSCFE